MLQLGIVLPIILKRISIDDSNKGQEEDLLLLPQKFYR